MPVPICPEPTRRRLMHETLQERIRELIMSGSLVPGERLDVDELCAWSGVSRTTARTAMLHLEHLGLIETAANRFTRVATVTHRDLADGVGVLASLWSYGVDLTLASAPVRLLCSHRDAVATLRQQLSVGEVKPADAWLVIAGLKDMFGFFLEESGCPLLVIAAAPLESRVQHVALHSVEQFDCVALTAIAAEVERGLALVDAKPLHAAIEAFRDLAEAHVVRAELASSGHRGASTGSRQRELPVRSEQVPNRP